MIINEIDRTVVVENPFEILRRPIAFFGKDEDYATPIYFNLLDEDGYRQNNNSLTFYSFDEFKPRSITGTAAYMLFEKDHGYEHKNKFFKIILSNKFHKLVKEFNNKNIVVNS